MVRHLFAILAALVALTAIPAGVRAQDAADKESLLSFGLGYYDIADDDGAADFRLEYRPDAQLVWKIKPWVGTEITSEGSTWTGGGVLADFDVANNYYVTPSFGVGLYSQGGSDKDLGSALEFRSQLEGGYKFQNGQKLGVAFGHISNASIGDDNPGTEILNLYYHVPVGNIF